jgi:hypothetical protein
LKVRDEEGRASEVFMILKRGCRGASFCSSVLGCAIGCPSRQAERGSADCTARQSSLFLFAPKSTKLLNPFRSHNTVSLFVTRVTEVLPNSDNCTIAQLQPIAPFPSAVFAYADAFSKPNGRPPLLCRTRQFVGSLVYEEPICWRCTCHNF